MSERGKLSIPFDTQQSQATASNPAFSIWVEANAGSGKTYVLTHRVLRLLLAGVRPQSILCLTYTKAAAAEMRRRVGERLAGWAVAEEEKLFNDIKDLTEAEPDGDLLAAARTLFARALETPGGLRILTIHAFCEAVLHRFPVEAGVPFDFSVIEEDRQVQMVLGVKEAVLAEGLRGGEHAEAVETLFGLMSDDAIAKAINSALGEGPRLDAVLADNLAKNRLRALVKHDGNSIESIRQRLVANTLLTFEVLQSVVRDCQGNPDGEGCVDLLSRLDPENPDPEILRAAFFTKSGEPRKKLLLKAAATAFPDTHDLLLAEQERLVALEAEMTAALLVARSEALLDVLSAIRKNYVEQKRRQALLDFDDLIEKLGSLLSDRAMGPWVQYKLDAGIDHILVDESQDTNGRQWRVVRALADEFFSGAGAVTRPRSIFAVGDQKQSIYSFQGAQPVLFGDTGRDMAQRARLARQSFESVKLHTSFRTLGGILEAVDRVTDRAEIQAALLASEKVIHQAARTQAGGTVTLWPPIQDIKDDRTDAGWPVAVVDAEQSAQRQVALRIAAEIRGWIDGGRVLGERNRPVVADDVLILVQKRGKFFQEIIRALRGARLPTPGADRLAVTGHIAVLDLLALIDVLLNPADELQLAALLRSPLFDVSEDDLFGVAHGRKGTGLWEAIAGSESASVKDAATRLRRWHGSLDRERPFEFLAAVLYAEGGLKRFHGRLGTEVDEVFSELLDLALAHEQGEQPSLQGFAAEMRRRSVTIKRELPEAGGGVRVMTVHGAKGLEAPIVILADATAKTSAPMRGKPIYMLTEAPGPLLVHASASAQHTPETLPIKDAADATLDEEYWRRLYVGMTRAEDELYLTGALSASQKAETQLDGSWYAAVEEALAGDLERIETDDGVLKAFVFPRKGEGRWLGSPAQTLRAYPPVDLAPVPPPPVPAVLAPSRAGVEANPHRLLQSVAEEVRDADTARRSGLALHALLQHLGRVERGQWEMVAPRALETLLPDFPDDHDRLAAKAIAILDRPELVELFGPASRAEVPFLLPLRRKGEPVRVSGRIDRLVVTADKVLVVDYKSDHNAPGTPAGVGRNYLTQLGLYALVASQLFPGRAIEAAILWTELESLMILPQDVLQAAAEDFTLE